MDAGKLEWRCLPAFECSHCRPFPFTHCSTWVASIWVMESLSASSRSPAWPWTPMQPSKTLESPQLCVDCHRSRGRWACHSCLRDPIGCRTDAKGPSGLSTRLRSHRHIPDRWQQMSPRFLGKAASYVRFVACHFGTSPSSGVNQGARTCGNRLAWLAISIEKTRPAR
jgi:hypothetical protein